MPRNLRVAIGCWAGVMVSSLAGVIVNGIEGNWPAVLWAATCFVCASGTLVAFWRWATWRGIAERAHHAHPPISAN